MTDLVPGKMHCAKCKFSLNRVNLNVNVGTVTAGDNSPERCPNGCGPLWPVTWEQEARENYDALEAMFERAKKAEDALAELQSRLGPKPVDMLAVCAALGFDPTNHHNAAKCPYCRHEQS